MNLLGGSIRIGHLFGVEVRIHSLFLFWIVFEIVRAGADWWETLWLFGTVFFIVLCHEIGHCFGARWVGGRAYEIILWPLGGLAHADAPMRPWPQFVTVACGPLVNLSFCVLSVGVLMGYFVLRALDVLPGGADPADEELMLPAWANSLLAFLTINLFLLGLNLLPIYPLDGGRLLCTILWPIIGFRRATLLTAQIGVVGSVLLGAVGLMVFGDFLLVLIAGLGALTSWRLYQAAQRGEVQEDSVRRPPRRPAEAASRMPRVHPAPARVIPDEYPPIAAGGAGQSAGPAAELDRILRKAAEQGVESLSYIERQRLECLARKRQQDGRDFDQQPRE